MRRIMSSAAAIALVAALMPQGGHAAETVRVFMNSTRFCTTPVCTENENVTIAVGDTVEWVFADPVCVGFHALGCYHTATRAQKPEKFGSPAMPGQTALGAPMPVLTFSHTFSETGTFDYFCAVHAGVGMASSIVVSG